MANSTAWIYCCLLTLILVARASGLRKVVDCNTIVNIGACPSFTPSTVDRILHAWYERNGVRIQNASASGGSLWEDIATPALHEARIQCKANVLLKNGNQGTLDSPIYVIIVQGCATETITTSPSTTATLSDSTTPSAATASSISISTTSTTSPTHSTITTDAETDTTLETSETVTSAGFLVIGSTTGAVAATLAIICGISLAILVCFTWRRQDKKKAAENPTGHTSV